MSISEAAKACSVAPFCAPRCEIASRCVRPRATTHEAASYLRAKQQRFRQAHHSARDGIGGDAERGSNPGILLGLGAILDGIQAHH